MISQDEEVVKRDSGAARRGRRSMAGGDRRAVLKRSSGQVGAGVYHQVGMLLRWIPAAPPSRAISPQLRDGSRATP